MKEKDLEGQTTFIKDSAKHYYDPTSNCALYIDRHGDVVLAEYCEVSGLQEDIGKPKDFKHLSEMYELITNVPLTKHECIPHVVTDTTGDMHRQCLFCNKTMDEL